MTVLRMPARKPPYRSTTPEAPPLALAEAPDPEAAGALCDQILTAIETAMVGPRARLLPADAIAAQVSALAITLAASAVADGDVADYLARAADGLRLGVERCRLTIAAELAEWPR